MKPKNLKEFKALIKRYESITFEEIKKKGKDYNIQNIPNQLTGFGLTRTCTLCRVLHCSECVYDLKWGCTLAKNEKTYYRIEDANTPTKLRNAFRARAKHMQTLLP